MAQWMAQSDQQLAQIVDAATADAARRTGGPPKLLSFA